MSAKTPEPGTNLSLTRVRPKRGKARKTSTAEVADKALAHKLPNRVEAAYRRTDFFEKRRDLMTLWAEYLDEGGKQTTKGETASALTLNPLRAAA